MIDNHHDLFRRIAFLQRVASEFAVAVEAFLAKQEAIRERDRLQVIVEDDGVGCAPPSSHRSGGFGLFSIRERLAYLGGRLELDSAPGRGTRVTLGAPLTKEAPRR